MGGGIFLLPILLYSNFSKGLSVSYNVTDNLYFLNIKDKGSIASVSSFFQFSDYFDFRYFGNFSMINFDNSNLCLDNYAGLKKEFYLPGVGNKNIIYSSLYSFFPTSYEIYRIIELTLGDSINFYLGDKYLLSQGLRFKYKNYFSDSIGDYIEPSINTSLSIPLPYFFFIPNFSTGFKVYDDKALHFYRLSSKFLFPLTLDLSFEFSLSYFYLAPPDDFYPISIPYMDDSFFEEETVKDAYRVSISFNKIFLADYSELYLNLILFNKRFMKVDDLEREDECLSVNIGFKKYISRNLFIYLKVESLINSSTLQSFDYIRNSLDTSIELIF